MPEPTKVSDLHKLITAYVNAKQEASLLRQAAVVPAAAEPLDEPTVEELEGKESEVAEGDQFPQPETPAGLSEPTGSPVTDQIWKHCVWIQYSIKSEVRHCDPISLQYQSNPRMHV